jgi:hypothetical protein
MRYAVPEYATEAINAAGKTLLSAPVTLFGPSGAEPALAVINNWRASHSFPLTVFAMTLRNRALKLDNHATVAQRLKRLSSIEAKLRRFDTMRLSQMQDIGGCRAIVGNAKVVTSLIRCYEDSTGSGRHKLIKVNDYIQNPKSDGYRSRHLVYEYYSKSRKNRVYNGKKIEIQIRSRLQHAWATAVETVDTFTGQALKSSGGKEEWRQFFALMGSALALREKTPLVPGTPTQSAELLAELKKSAAQLNVFAQLEAWGAALNYTKERTTGADIFLLFLDAEDRKLQVTGFERRQLELASAQYLKAEKKTEGKAGSQAVLVTVDSLDALRKAYPNYFIDTDVFIKALRLAIS